MIRHSRDSALIVLKGDITYYYNCLCDAATYDVANVLSAYARLHHTMVRTCLDYIKKHPEDSMHDLHKLIPILIEMRTLGVAAKRVQGNDDKFRKIVLRTCRHKGSRI